jgi:glycerol-3-phosphate cytidylyltransferase-like family protein
MTPKDKAIQLINKFTYWNTSQAEREGILSALNVVDEVLNIIEYKDLKYWDEVKNEIINYKNNLI